MGRNPKDLEFEMLWENLMLTGGKPLQRLSLREQKALKDLMQSIHKRSEAKVDALQKRLEEVFNSGVVDEVHRDHLLINLIMTRFDELSSKLENIQYAGGATFMAGSRPQRTNESEEATELHADLFKFSGTTNIDSVKVNSEQVEGVSESVEELRRMMGQEGDN